MVCVSRGEFDDSEHTDAFNGTQEKSTLYVCYGNYDGTDHKTQKQDGDFSPSLFYANKISSVKGSIREGAVERM